MKQQKGTWRIQFYVKDKLISNDATIYGAIHKCEQEFRQSNKKVTTHPNIWTTAYPITFKRVFIPEDGAEKVKNIVKSSKRQLDEIDIPKQLIANKDSPCMSVLKLLKALVNVCHSWQIEDTSSLSSNNTTHRKKSPLLPSSDFINRKLSAKMQRQLEEPLIVASSCLPEWAYYFMSEYPFLFPFDIRYLFIQSTSFGYSRLIARWQSLEMRNNTQNGQRADRHNGSSYDDGSNGSHPPPSLGRVERRKVKVKRDQILESAIKFMDLFGSSQSILEIEYAEEEGTGLGPTLEFYALASKEFCKKSTNMWRHDEEYDDSVYVVAKQGLFPAPLYKSTNAKSRSKIIHLFKSLGQFVAKAMLDFRIIDIPFSIAFFKLLLNDDIQPIDLVQVYIYDFFKKENTHFFIYYF